MIPENGQMVVVTGATGLQGGAVARNLLSRGWQVRAVTRNAQSDKARALAGMGAAVVQADMADRDALVPVFQGAYGVFSVQNPVISGIAGEIRQGINVGEAAKQAGVQHLVYSSAGLGQRGTGVPSWESKLVIEDHLKSLGLPLTILRPMAFMELMTEKKFFPAVSTWQIMPQLMGSTRNVVWICADDLGFIAAKAFEDPEQFIGKEFQLCSDVQSMDACRDIYRKVMGKNPAQFPMPVWIFERFGFIGDDLPKMWRWLRNGAVDVDPSITRSLHPDAASVQAWLERQTQAKLHE